MSVGGARILVSPNLLHLIVVHGRHYRRNDSLILFLQQLDLRIDLVREPIEEVPPIKVKAADPAEFDLSSPKTSTTAWGSSYVLDIGWLPPTPWSSSVA